MCVILGAANAYLGLRAGMTIAATYPAAVIGMAVLRLFKGSVLEENFARTVGSIGESVAAGAAFTIPAFVILNYFDFGIAGVVTPEGVVRMSLWQQYAISSALMILGGILGIFLVTILRRVMVEDPSLPFPESVAASEIHKAGQRGSEAAMQLFQAMGVGALIRLLGRTDEGTFDGLGIFYAVNRIQVGMGRLKEGLRSPRGRSDGGRRRRDHLHLAGGDACLPRRRLHHRSRAGRAELRGRPARVGPLRPAARLLHRPDDDRRVRRPG